MAPQQPYLPSPPMHLQAGYPQAGYPQPGYPQAGYPQAGYPQAGFVAAQGPKRNVALLAVGAVLLVVGLLAGAVFLRNLYEYMTVDSHFTTLPRYAQAFAVRIARAAAMRRMTIFGPVSGFFSIVGLVLAGLGARKK